MIYKTLEKKLKIEIYEYHQKNGLTQVLQKGTQFYWHPSCSSCQYSDDKSWLSEWEKWRIVFA
jgi:hypothetical protein